jgi:hypothetical protein
MAYISLYSASIYQSASNVLQITASSGGKSTNAITGSWSRLTTGSYMFVSSGSFSGASGSITGSMAINVALFATGSASSYQANGLFAYTSRSNANAIFINTYSDFISQTLADNAIGSGSCNLSIGINY